MATIQTIIILLLAFACWLLYELIKAKTSFMFELPVLKPRWPCSAAVVSLIPTSQITISQINALFERYS